MESLRKQTFLQNCKCHLKIKLSVPSISGWYLQMHITDRNACSDLYEHSYAVFTAILFHRVERQLLRQNISLLRLRFLPSQDLFVAAKRGLLLNKPLHHCCFSIRLTSSV